MKLTSDVKQRKQRSQHNSPNPNNSYKTKKKFTGSYTEVNPKILSLSLSKFDYIYIHTCFMFKKGVFCDWLGLKLMLLRQVNFKIIYCIFLAAFPWSVLKSHWLKTITAKSHICIIVCISNLHYLWCVIQPVVTTKALFNMQLLVSCFEDIWKSCWLKMCYLRLQSWTK